MLKNARQVVWSWLTPTEIAAHRERYEVGSAKYAWERTVAEMVNREACAVEADIVAAWAGAAD
jgi:hypothetical protein